MRGREVARVLSGEATVDGGGVHMTRVIGNAVLDSLDPFLMLDEFHSDDPADYVAGFPDHPHRGFETITYMLAGTMKHGDNQGHEGCVGPGGVQWMTAGRGIVHHEFPQQSDGLLWGFQFWLNLPSAEKMCEPRYRDLAPAEIPVVQLHENLEARVIAGSLGGSDGPIQHAGTQPLIVDLRFSGPCAAEIAVPADKAAAVYVYQGRVSFARHSAEQGELCLLSDGDLLHAHAEGNAGAILLAGKPLNEPVARYGPFVMNSQREIVQAVEDYRAGRL